MKADRKNPGGWAIHFAAAALFGGVFLVTPTAHAAANCAVPGPRLDLHHISGYDVSVDANGASLGPGAVISTPQQTSRGNVSGGINGRAIDFTVNFSGTRAYDHFTGTVGNDGVAHGTSVGTQIPIGLDPGPWDSVTRLTC